MKTCPICSQEVTRRMIREGGAISRGGVLLHRDCRRPEHEAEFAAGPPEQPASSLLRATTGEYASFWRRLGAHFIDGMILTGISAAIGFVLGPTAARVGAGTGSVVMLAFQALLVLVPVVYFTFSWSRKGATPGKSALGIRVVGVGNTPVTGVQAVVRYFGYILSSFLCLGFLWMLWDAERRCWHDMLAGTRVIRV
jgi:uncharacterized RDD family membrane protein YckC